MPERLFGTLGCSLARGKGVTSRIRWEGEGRVCVVTFWISQSTPARFNE